MILLISTVTPVHALRGHAAIPVMVISYICASTNLIRSEIIKGTEEQHGFLGCQVKGQNPGLAHVDKQS